jgi:DNA (cytosine-5)-methyltransferase 1
LVGEVFRLLRRRAVPWVLLENVSFMLRLKHGSAMRLIIANLEDLGYKWAYRVVDSRAFGVPQRRERVFILATNAADADPRDVILGEDAGTPDEPTWDRSVPGGFYWTEGTRGLGWAVDAVPTLKGGSTVGIPSPPAVLLPDGRVITPSITDAERLQGFPLNWTKTVQSEGSKSFRWKLVGNAVTVDVAEWIGQRLRNRVEYVASNDPILEDNASLPFAAYNVGDGTRVAAVSPWPAHNPTESLATFLDLDQPTLLSAKATAGFLSRFESSSLRKPPGFVEALRCHLGRMQATMHRRAQDKAALVVT